MKRLMDIFVERLNDNDAGQVFKGNFLFQFSANADHFEIYSTQTHTLVKETTTYSPVMQTLAEAVMFTDKSKRIDWQVEHYIAIRVQGDEYTEAYTETLPDDIEQVDNTLIIHAINTAYVEQVGNTLVVSGSVSGEIEDMNAYQVVRNACASLNKGFGDSVIEHDGRRYVFNAQPPKKIGYFERGSESYILLVCVMTVTETVGGQYGQDTAITLDTNELDVITMRKVSTTRMYTADEKDGSVNDFHLPIGRHMMFVMEINLLDKVMYADITGKSDLDVDYDLVVDEETYKVSIQSATEVLAPNKVRMLELELVEVQHGTV